MKNFLLAALFIAVLSAILQQFLPWWIIAPVGFISGYTIRQSAFNSFVAGFIAIFLLWIVYAWMLSSNNNDILAKKIAELLPLKGHILFLYLITGLIGGLVSGFASLTGKLAANLRGT